jgi:hypothetical protein
MNDNKNDFDGSSISDKGMLSIKVYAKRHFPMSDNFMGELPLPFQNIGFVNNQEMQKKGTMDDFDYLPSTISSAL